MLTSVRGITLTRRGTGGSFKIFGVQHPPRDQHEAAAGAGIVITFLSVSIKHPSFLLVGKVCSKGGWLFRGSGVGFSPDYNFLGMEVMP